MSSTTARLGGFTLAAALMFLAAFGAGRLVGPTDAEPAPAMAGMEPESGHEGMAAKPATDQEHPAGLQVSESGYTLEVLAGPTAAGTSTELAFRIVGPGGLPTTSFRPNHDKLMHLIVVRRDLAFYQHIHPTMTPDGTWHIALRLPEAGTYRVLADFVPDSHDKLTLGTDLPIAGDYRPAPLPGPSRTATVDGYTVTLDGTLSPGKDSELTFTVSKDGRPVTDLQRYLAAYGHLVILRPGDLGYLHVHPHDSATPGPAISFTAEIPTSGQYRLYLDFQHGDQVRTATLTAEAGR
jgi:hypothetical protein